MIFQTGDHQTEIPLWVNFCAISYNKLKTLEDRNRDPIGFAGNANLSVALPFDGNFVSKNNLNYTNDPNQIIAQITGADPKTRADKTRIKGLPFLLEQDQGSGKVSINDTPENEIIDPNVYMSVDMMDMMFLGGGKRSYVITCKLVCKSAEDSKAAARVCSMLSSQCWPLLQSQGVLDGNAKLLHPDLWVVWMSIAPGLLVRAREWHDGIGPQLSVLTSVQTARAGGENNRVLAIGSLNNARDVLPLIYTISLTFSELEPAIQDPYDWTVINRSRALKGGVNQPTPSSNNP